MKSFTFIIALLTSSKLFAQTVEVTTEDKSSNSKEDYFVLKSNQDIKEGSYTKYTFFSNGIICTGFYKNNLKDSLWIDYPHQDFVADSGYYKQGKKVGIWKAYKLSGQLQVQYDYTNNQLIYYKPNPDDKTKTYSVLDGPNKKDLILDQPPIYLDGEIALNYTIGIRTGYPAKARENQIQGKVIIGITIDELGNPIAYRVIKPLGYDCDEAALKAAK